MTQRSDNKGPNEQGWYSGDLFGEVYQAEQEVAPPENLRWTSYVPGLLICGVASLAALWLADAYGFPAILLGLLIGLALNFISDNPRTSAGLDFASRHFLRLGIVLLGLQITLGKLVNLGVLPFAALVGIMACAFGAGLLGAKFVGQSRYAGILAGGATAICGASAALALYGIIGRDRLDQARFTVTLVGVALTSGIALTTYPLLAQAIGLNDAQAGYLVGASIHDVAQAIGGGYAISDSAGEQATVIKLARVALLAPVVGLVALWIGKPADTATGAQNGAGIWKRLALPWFILAFLAVVVLGSVVQVPDEWRESGLTASKSLLLLAVTATAMRSRMDLLLEAGWKPLVPVVCATLVSFTAALIAAYWLI